MEDNNFETNSKIQDDINDEAYSSSDWRDAKELLAEINRTRDILNTQHRILNKSDLPVWAEVTSGIYKGSVGRINVTRWRYISIDGNARIYFYKEKLGKEIEKSIKIQQLKLSTEDKKNYIINKNSEVVIYDTTGKILEVNQLITFPIYTDIAIGTITEITKNGTVYVNVVRKGNNPPKQNEKIVKLSNSISRVIVIDDNLKRRLMELRLCNE